MKKPASRAARKLRASLRNTLVLLREFHRPLLLFLGLILGSGLLYYSLAISAGERFDNPVETVYLMLSLTFLQANGDFPHAWFLQVFYFAMPFFGIAILAQGLTDFGVLLFNRRAHGKEWEMAVASTYNNHIVLVGLGHLGYRVARKLYEMDQEMVVIEMNPKTDLLATIRDLDIPVLVEDGTREEILIGAGIKHARAILLCTQNDAANLKMALKARSLNSDIEVIVRIFDDDFADSLQKQFGFHALSATGMAAPIFAATAAGVDITPPITIDGQPNSLARIKIQERSLLKGKSVSDIEVHYDLSVVLLRRDGTSDSHPAGSRLVQTNDTLAVLGSPDHISLLLHDNT